MPARWARRAVSKGRNGYRKTTFKRSKYASTPYVRRTRQLRGMGPVSVTPVGNGSDIMIMQPRSESKYLYKSHVNLSASTIVGQAVAAAASVMPQTGVGQHNMIGLQCWLTGMHIKGDVNVQFDPTANPGYVSNARLVILWDTQPANSLYNYGVATSWQQTVFEADTIYAPFQHQKPRRFTVLHDEMFTFSLYSPRTVQFDKYIKLDRLYTAYDGIAPTNQQFPLSGCIKWFVLTTETLGATHYNLEKKIYFREEA